VFVNRTTLFINQLDVYGILIHHLDLELLARIRAGSASVSDIDAAVPLAHALHDEFRAFGTDGNTKITSDEAREVVTALRTVLRRLGIKFELPFTDFAQFKDHWIAQGASGNGGWSARRRLLCQLFSPLHAKLADLQEESLRSSLASPAGDRSCTGWSGVDELLIELRRHFQNARTEQDYRNIGNDCIAVLESLSAVAYDPGRHLPPDADEPPVAKTKARLERVIEIDLAGPDKAKLRALTRATIEHAQEVKHQTPSRQEAGIAADSVILLVSMIRRLRDPDF